MAEVTTGFGLGYGDGCPTVYMSFTIKAYAGEDPWGPGASVYVDGVCIGTRCAARNALAASYAPVIAWIAAHEAAAAAQLGASQIAKVA